jgi:hypothetical protein
VGIGKCLREQDGSSLTNTNKGTLPVFIHELLGNPEKLLDSLKHIWSDVPEDREWRMGETNTSLRGGAPFRIAVYIFK